MLPVKKIYVDTRHKTPDSISNSNFTVQLPETFYMPDDAVFYIDDVTIPYTWSTIETDHNDKLYIMTIDTNNFNAKQYFVITIPPGVYSGTQLATEIRSKLSPYFSGSFSVLYDAKLNTISITQGYTNIFKIRYEHLSIRISET